MISIEQSLLTAVEHGYSIHDYNELILTAKALLYPVVLSTK
jgi:hypothetical protein